MSGNSLAVGATAGDSGGSSTGATYVFSLSGISWSQQAKLTPADSSSDAFGHSVAISGNYLVAGEHTDDRPGANQAGAAYVFSLSGTSWTELQKLQPRSPIGGPGNYPGLNDYFGWSVAISETI
jgi:hypothetical protein